jgi:hypothetical protein
MVLLAVLLIVAITALAATTAIYFAMAERSAVAASERRVQARLAAWTGVQVIAAELAAQRGVLLAGGEPRVSAQGRVGEGGAADASAAAAGGAGAPAGEAWSWQLVKGAMDVEAEGASAGASAAVGVGEGFAPPPDEEPRPEAEAARLDLNWAEAGMLAAAGLGERGAARVVAARGGGRRIGGVEELGAMGVVVPAGVLARFTVFAADAPEPVGVGAGGASGAGAGGQGARVRLDDAWTPEGESALAKVLRAETVAALKAMVEATKGAGLRRDGAVVEGLLARNVPVEEVARVLDACLTGGDGAGVRLGRVDVNRATAEVLAAVPGLTAETAAAIVERRGRVAERERQSVAWLLTERVVEPPAFVKAVDWLTVRTMQWRVLVAGGREAGDGVAVAGGGAAAAGGFERVVLEAVIDLAEAEVRIAELRDVTRWRRTGGGGAAAGGAGGRGGAAGEDGVEEAGDAADTMGTGATGGGGNGEDGGGAERAAGGGAGEGRDGAGRNEGGRGGGRAARESGGEGAGGGGGGGGARPQPPARGPGRVGRWRVGE